MCLLGIGRRLPSCSSAAFPLYTRSSGKPFNLCPSYYDSGRTCNLHPSWGSECVAVGRAVLAQPRVGRAVQRSPVGHLAGSAVNTGWCENVRFRVRVFHNTGECSASTSAKGMPAIQEYRTRAPSAELWTPCVDCRVVGSHRYEQCTADCSHWSARTTTRVSSRGYGDHPSGRTHRGDPRQGRRPVRVRTPTA
jgi:hypothetical protein